MERKKIIALVSLFVLAIGIGALAVWMKNKPTKEQKVFADKFTETMRKNKNLTRVGVVESIESGNLIIRLKDLQTKTKLSEETIFLTKAKKTESQKIKKSDVKVGDLVSVEYDKVTTIAETVTVLKM